MYWALQTLKFSLNPECSPTSLLDEVPGHWVKGKASVIWLGETESFPVVQGRGNAYCLSRLQRHCQPPLQASVPTYSGGTQPTHPRATYSRSFTHSTLPHPGHCTSHQGRHKVLECRLSEASLKGGGAFLSPILCQAVTPTGSSKEAETHSQKLFDAQKAMCTSHHLATLSGLGHVAEW